MNIVEIIQEKLFSFLKEQFSLSILPSSIECNLNSDPERQLFGDINCNAALVLAKEYKKNPREIAQTIVNQFKDEQIAKIEIAGPGFVNLFLTDQATLNLAKQLGNEKESFFKPTLKKIHNVNIEFVSANPTGPLHFGHGRGGIIGDVLGNIVAFMGHHVTKEFYVNDAGSQMQKLGDSFKIRCLQALGKDVHLPEDGYHGEYLKNLAGECVQSHGETLLKEPHDFFVTYAYKNLLKQIIDTLKLYGISFDVWFSEKNLHDKNEIKKAIDLLKEHHYLYEKEGALWFKATDFGDDKDRVLKKSDGQYTYVAADTPYLMDKVDRGFDKLIMVLGQDHHSYATRLQGLKNALNLDCTLDVILYQLVTLKEGGQLLRMSKRAGKMVTLLDVIETVGPDVARFFFINRKADAHLDFDLELALKKTDENPVYYIQYAYVRTRSILEKAQEHAELKDINVQDIADLNEAEKNLLKKIVSLKPLLSLIGTQYQTHLLSYYLYELAQEFHRYYTKNRAINLEDITQSRSRLMLIHIIKDTFELCLTLLGISIPEKM